jgi:hypothetical protein
MGDFRQQPRLGINVSVSTTRAISGTVALINGAVSFGMQTSGGSYVVTASAAGATTGIQSISAGTTRITSGTVVLNSGGGISFGITGNSISAQFVPITFWDNSRWFPGPCAAGSEYTSTANSQTLPIGALFQRVEIGAPIAATRLELVFGGATDAKKIVSCALGTWSITPGQYMFGLATASSTIAVGIYTMTGSTANLVSSASRTFTIAGTAETRVAGWTAPDATYMGAPGGATYAHYWADGTFTAATLPTSSVHISDIRQTIQWVSTTPLPPLLGVQLNVPYFQIIA